MYINSLLLIIEMADLSLTVFDRKIHIASGVLCFGRQHVFISFDDNLAVVVTNRIFHHLGLYRVVTIDFVFFPIGRVSRNRP